MPVVNVEPLFSFRPDIIQSLEDIHIQHRLLISAIKAFDETVLHRASRLDEFEFDAVLLNPVSNGKSR